MYLVFRNMDQWFEHHGELLKRDDGKRVFKEKFDNTYKVLLRAIKEQVKSINQKIKAKTGKSISIKVSEVLLKQALIDAFDDLARITQYHITDDPNPIKEAAYISYWFIKRKPIIVLDEDVVFNNEINDIGKMRLMFLNEEFCIKLLIGETFPDYKIRQDCALFQTKADEQIKIFKRTLLYYLVYRLESPKSLEAILLSLTIFPIWEVNPIIWDNPEKLNID